MGWIARGRATRRARSGGAAVLVALLAVPIVSPPASAQDAEIGSAKAIAVVLKVAPTVGALELALGSGVAVSEVRNQLAQAQTTAVELGLIGSTLTQDNCKGEPGRFKPSDLPQALRTDNRQGDSKETSVEAPLAPGTFDGVTQIVTATKQPYMSAWPRGS